MKRTLAVAGLVAAFASTTIISGCGCAKDAADSARQVAENARDAAEREERPERASGFRSGGE